jgi:alkaline phosphatase
VTYGTTGHTNELVNLYAKGASANHVAAFTHSYDGLSIVDNTSIYHLLMTAANP